MFTVPAGIASGGSGILSRFKLVGTGPIVNRFLAEAEISAVHLLPFEKWVLSRDGSSLTGKGAAAKNGHIEMTILWAKTMETFAITKFKANCLALIDEVSRQKKRIVITRHGKPIAEVIPYRNETAGASAEVPLKDTLLFMGDIVSSVAEDWEALR